MSLGKDAFKGGMVAWGADQGTHGTVGYRHLAIASPVHPGGRPEPTKIPQVAALGHCIPITPHVADELYAISH